MKKLGLMAGIVLGLVLSASAQEAKRRTYSLEFSTYFGGSGSDMIRDITVDAQGNIYVVGIAGSADFPRTPGNLPGQSAEGSMVAKFSPAGGLLWSKVVKGPFFYSVKVDKAGYIYVAGRVAPGFPTTPGAFQPTTSRACGFVGKLKPDASDWVWCSYVGVGNLMRDMTIDEESNVYGVLDFYAESKEVLPASWFKNAFCKTPHTGTMDHFGHCDAGVIKISSAGEVIWATWIGGTNGNDMIASVAVGKDHCPVLMLCTASWDMPTTPGAFCRTSPDPARLKAGLPIPWVGKLLADGSNLLFGTYLGVSRGMPLARTHNVAVDAQGNIFATFQTQDDLPVTPGAFQTKFGGGKGAAGIEKLSPTGALLAATYLGGSGQDACNGPDQIVVDGDGNVMIACCTSSTDYPVTPGAFQPHNAGAGGKFPFDGAVSILSNDLSTLLYSTYIGGTGDEMARACCFGRDGTLYVAGVTASRDFPTKNAYQDKYGGDPGFGSTPNGGQYPVGWGNGDGWVAKFRLVPPGELPAGETRPATTRPSTTTPSSATVPTTVNPPSPATAPAGKTTLKMIEGDVWPVNDKSVVVFKTTPQGDLKINLFFPQDWKASERRPAIVFFFGGGFVGGDPRQFTGTAEYFASRGMVAATAEYRIRSLHHTDPEQGVEDAKSAVRWLRMNAPRLGIDPGRIVALGASSGGTCAADAGYGKEFEAEGEDRSVSSKPDALVLFYPHLGWPSDTSKNKPEEVQVINKLTAVFEGWRGKEKGPPAIIFLGTKDNLLFEKVRLFAAQVAAAGSRVEFYTAQDQGHGFCGDRPGNPWHALVVERTDLFLSSLGYLKGKPTVVLPADFKGVLTKE